MILEIKEEEIFALKWLLLKGMEMTKSNKKYDVFDKLTEQLKQKQARQPLAAGILGDKRIIKPAIKHLGESFNKAQKHLDGGTFDDLKMACAELFISNAEARQLLSKLSV